jgi:beta-1,6-galactosyltransferase
MNIGVSNRRALDKTISDIEMRLAAARAAQAMSQGMSPSDSEGDQGSMRHRMSFVMGVFTTFANRKRRDSIRQTWMPQGRCPFLNFCTVEPLFHVKC